VGNLNGNNVNKKKEEWECIEMNLNDPTKKEEENVYVSLFRRLVRPPFFFR
jgi:hypothetical protein